MKPKINFGFGRGLGTFMSRIRAMVLLLAAAFFAAYAAPAGATANPAAVKEIQALLNELGYVPGTSTSGINHDTDTALTLFFKAENQLACPAYVLTDGRGGFFC